MSEKIGLFLCCAPSSELGTGDGGSNGDIQALRTLALMEVWDEQAVGDALAHSLGNAIALVAHDDDALLRQGLLIDVVAIEQGAIDGIGWGKGVEKLQEVTVYNMYVRKASHRGLYHLGVVGVGRVFAAIDGVDAEPVGNADDGAEVAGVLDAIERE